KGICRVRQISQSNLAVGRRRIVQLDARSSSQLDESILNGRLEEAEVQAEIQFFDTQFDIGADIVDFEKRGVAEHPGLDELSEIEAERGVNVQIRADLDRARSGGDTQRF